MNYIILLATGIISKVKKDPAKLLISSVIGSAYTVIAYIITLENGISLLLKILLSIAMVYIAFIPPNYKLLLKNLLIFYLTSFTFGGVAFFLLYFVKPQEILVRNGIFIGTYPIKIALLGGIVGFIVITIAFKCIKSKLSKKDMLCNITLKLDSKSISTMAFVDTGNLLKDPITGMPVIIVEKDKLLALVPEEILNKVLNGQLKEAEYISKFRLIPFNSLGRENGMLLGIKIDSLEIQNNEEVISINNVIVGIYEKKLTQNNKYSALIGLELLNI